MPLFLVPYYFGDVDPADLTADTEYSEGEAVEVGTYLHAGKEDQATFCLKPLASGLVYLVLYMPNGTPLADAVIQVSDTFGTYNDYVINESEIYLDQDADGRPIPCPSVYGVKFTDNPESTVPQGKPAENIYLYACVAVPSAAEDEYLTYDSVRFHGKLGFTEAGRFHRCGFKFGRWYDMIWMEKMLGEHVEKPRPVQAYADVNFR